MVSIVSPLISLQPKCILVILLLKLVVWLGDKPDYNSYFLTFTLVHCSHFKGSCLFRFDQTSK